MEKGDSEAKTPGARLERWIELTYGGWGGKSKCARDLGTTPQQLSKYIQDKLSPQADMRRKLAELGLNLHWWETGEGPMKAPSKFPNEVGATGRILGAITFKTVEIDGKQVTILEGFEPEQGEESDEGKE